MPYINDTLDVLTEDLWQDIEDTRGRATTSVTPAQGRMTGFFNSLAASMALLQQATTRRHQPLSSLSATDMLAQNYPHLYLRVMCG